MRSSSLRSIAGAIAILTSTAFAGPTRAGDLTRNPHQEALLALADIDVAIDALNKASSVTANSGDPYKQQARRAANAIVGVGGSGYDPSAGEPIDRSGALDHLSWLSAHAGNSAWGPAVRGSVVNLKVAGAHLAESAKADGLETFWSQTSDALQSLLIAAGRSSQLGVLGGLRGALATTDLGVPPNGKVVPGCTVPSEFPAYGVAKGYLTYVALPRDEEATRLPEVIGVRDVSVRSNGIVVHTAAADLVGELCPIADAVATANASNMSTTPDPPANTGALYTEQQAERGKHVFDSNCSSCHGNNLQGASAPPIGGSTFMRKAKMLDWKVSDMRNLVVTSMPANNPGSLTKQQYADVLAYLLAVNCYPSGDRSFPTSATLALRQTQLQPIRGAKDENSKNDTCPVKG